jgi:hypothetical protein
MLTMPQQMVLVALKKLFDAKSYFDVCQVDALLVVTRGRMSDYTRNELRLVHCVHYKDMPDGMREHLAQVVVAALKTGMPDLEFSIKVPVQPVVVHDPPTPSEARSNLFRRLLGSGKS